MRGGVSPTPPYTTPLQPPATLPPPPPPTAATTTTTTTTPNYLRRISPPGSPSANALVKERCCYAREYNMVGGGGGGRRGLGVGRVQQQQHGVMTYLCCCCCGGSGGGGGGGGNGAVGGYPCDGTRGNASTSILATLGVCCLVLGYTVLGAFTFMALEGGIQTDSAVAASTKTTNAIHTPTATTITQHLNSVALDPLAPPPSGTNPNHPPPPPPLQPITTAIGTLRTKTVDRLWHITENLNILYRENWTRLAAEEVLDFQSALFRALRNGNTVSTGGGETVYYLHTSPSHGDDQQQRQHRWSFTSSFLYSLTLITTIGYGSVSPRTTWGKLVTIIYALVGIPLMLLYLSTTGAVLARIFRRLYGKLCTSSSTNAAAARAGKLGTAGACPCTTSSGGRYCTSGLSNAGQSHRVRVPVTLCLVMVLGYIGSGAVLFQRLENWSLLEGSYFCFTSLGTIGFGDLLPGQRHTDEDISLFACSAYILTGMALVAMCFSLVQDEILALLRLVGTSTTTTTQISSTCHRAELLKTLEEEQQLQQQQHQLGNSVVTS